LSVVDWKYIRFTLYSTPLQAALNCLCGAFRLIDSRGTSAQIRSQIHSYTDCPDSGKTVQCATEEIMLIILLVVLLLLSLGSLPAWPYSREWGYYPSGGLGLVVVVLVVLLLLGRI